MLPEQSDFTSHSISQLQVPSVQVPWELQSLSIKQTNTREIKLIKALYPDNWKIFIHLNVIIVEYFKSSLGQDIKFFHRQFLVQCSP